MSVGVLRRYGRTRLGAAGLPARPLESARRRGASCVESNVDHQRLARVNSHPNTYRASLKRSLAITHGSQGITRPRKRDEECVSLGVYLHTAVAVERFSKQPPVLDEHLGVVVAEFLQRPRRALDVREQERHGASDWQPVCGVRRHWFRP
jgi:hypothetical protein